MADAGAALSVYTRSGRRLVAVDDALGPASDDGDQPCSAAAAAALERILHDGFGFLLESWCNAAAAAGQVAPPEYLPDLLEARARKDASGFGDAISRVVRSRGQWIAPLVDWRVAEPAPADEAAWATGSAEQRLAALARQDTAEAISVVNSGVALAAHFGDGTPRADDVAAGLTGAIVKDPVQDAVVWKEYLETVVKERDGWKDLYRACRKTQ